MHRTTMTTTAMMIGVGSKGVSAVQYVNSNSVVSTPGLGYATNNIPFEESKRYDSPIIKGSFPFTSSVALSLSLPP